MYQYSYFRMHNYNVYRSSAIYDVTVTTFKRYRSHNSSLFTFLCFFDTLADFPEKVLFSDPNLFLLAQVILVCGL